MASIWEAHDFIVLFMMLPSFAQTNPTSENCQTPLEVMSSILDEPLVESDLGKCVGSGDMATDQKLAVQLKQILDAKGIFIDYEIISDDPNHRNENEEAKQKITSKLPQLFIVQNDNKTWQLSNETQKIIPQIHETTFLFSQAIYKIGYPKVRSLVFTFGNIHFFHSLQWLVFSSVECVINFSFHRSKNSMSDKKSVCDLMYLPKCDVQSLRWLSVWY